MTPHDQVQPASPPGGDAGSTAPQPNYKRSGSQKRERCKKLEVVLTPDEYAGVKARAVAAGLSASSWGYAVIFGSPGPRARRVPHVNAVELGKAVAALNQSGNVLNQMQHSLNAGEAISLGRACAEALAANRRAADAILELVGRKERDE